MADLSLMIQTSKGQLSLGLAAHGGLVFDSEAQAAPPDAASRQIAPLLNHGLNMAGYGTSDIGAVFVDIGPGGLGATRSGVSFANGLAYALSIPVGGIGAFDLIGAEVAHRTGKPARIIRHAARPRVYDGIYAGGQLRDFSLRPIDDVLAEICGGCNGQVLAGHYKFSEKELAGRAPPPEPLVNHASMAVFLSLIRDEIPSEYRVFPITDRVAP